MSGTTLAVRTAAALFIVDPTAWLGLSEGLAPNGSPHQSIQ
jgi:hypothetical protein